MTKRTSSIAHATTPCCRRRAMSNPLWLCLSPDERTALNKLLDLNRFGEGSEHAAAIRKALEKYEGALDERFVEAARELNFMRDGECEVDDHAVVSDSEDGAYVMAWAWVDRQAVEPDYVPSYCRD